MIRALQSRRNPLAQGLLALALFAIGLHAALPKGYMLDFNAETGGIAVVFCSTGMGAETRMLDLASGEIIDPGTAPGRYAESGVCAFAVAAAASADLPGEIVPIAPLLSVERVRTRETQAALRRVTRPIPPARGPPHSV